MSATAKKAIKPLIKVPIIAPSMPQNKPIKNPMGRLIKKNNNLDGLSIDLTINAFKMTIPNPIMKPPNAPPIAEPSETPINAPIKTESPHPQSAII